MAATVDEVMTRNPKTIGRDTLAGEALELLNSSKITALIVTDATSRSASCICTICCERAWRRFLLVVPGRVTWRGPGIHTHDALWIPSSFRATRPGMTATCGNRAPFSSSGSASPFAR